MLTIVRVFDAFIYNVTNPGPVFIFIDVSDSKYIAQCVILVTIVLVADCVSVSLTVLDLAVSDVHLTIDADISVIHGMGSK